ncbi:DUF2127 domain-containing protein [Paracoccus sp. (in: a-proteobacteria)]|uniref:DUF2127 domain-containing protein n=1 Tax=Paracoccus sp. TaxID=267 RepID=UPI0032201DC0
MNPGQPRAGALHRLFESGLLLKSALAALEVAAGLGLWLLPHRLVADFAARLARNDLVESREGPVFVRLDAALGGLSSAGQDFYAFYLLAHGTVKLAILVLLLRGVGFAYPLAVAVFSGFVALQMLRWTQTHSPMLLALSALDALVIWLTLREWREAPRAA